MTPTSAPPNEHRLLERFLWLSVATAVATVTLKVIAAMITNSVGMWSDALESTVNLLAVNIGWLISGTVVIESLFAIPGIGQLLVRGIFTRDYMVVQGVAMVLACATVVVNFVADVVTVALDPRVNMQ